MKSTPAVFKSCCLYHGKKFRSRYQFIMNQLRGNVIPVPCLSLVHKHVCCCRAHDVATATPTPESSTADVIEQSPEETCKSEEMEVVDESSLTAAYCKLTLTVPKSSLNCVMKSERIPAQCKKYLQMWYEKESRSTEEQCCNGKQLVELIRRCLKSDFTLLSDPKLEARSFDILLPIPYNKLGHFFGKKGKGIKDLSEFNQFRATVIPDQSKENTESLVRILCANPESKEEVRQLILEKAKSVAEEILRRKEKELEVD